MTAEQAIKEYSEKFGGFPYMLFMGADDNVIINAVKKALKDGKEIEPENPDLIY